MLVVERRDAGGCAATTACRCRTRRPPCRRCPATVKSCDWMSTPISRKWRFTHSQRALGGDAHLLVVVAGRAAGGERVAEPEAVLGRRAHWRCRRTTPCPCPRPRPGTDRPRRSAPDARAGTTSLPSTLSVRSSSAANERLVALDALALASLRDSPQADCFGNETALGADRHDHRVLHLLRLHQPQHLGAEVLAPVGPAQAAAGDLAQRRCTPSTRGE